MTIKDLFLSFEGRIGREQYWIATIAVALVAVALQWLVGIPVMGDPPTFPLRVVAFVIGVASSYPTIAISVKRLHDRDQPGTYAWFLVAAFAVVLIGDLFGAFDETAELNAVIWIAMLFVLVIAVGFLVELGFRRGTAGPNAYGPDPLQPAITD